MNDLARWKSINAYNILSFIIQLFYLLIFIYIGAMTGFRGISLVMIAIGLTTFILTLLFNVWGIVYYGKLDKKVDETKKILIFMILSIFFLGVIFNLANIILISKMMAKIKKDNDVSKPDVVKDTPVPPKDILSIY